MLHRQMLTMTKTLSQETTVRISHQSSIIDKVNKVQEKLVRMKRSKIVLKELCHLPDWLVSFNYSKTSR